MKRKMIKGGVSLPPPYSILLILCTLQFTAFSQSNLIKNPKITGDTTGMNWNPFAENMVPNWRLILHSPDLMRGYVHSTPSSGRVWGYVPAAYQELHCEAIGQNIDSLEPGECHIIDLSPYPDIFWSIQPPPVWPNWQYLYGACCKALWESRYTPYIGGMNCTYDNTFTNSCKNQIQGNKYHDHTR